MCQHRQAKTEATDVELKTKEKDESGSDSTSLPVKESIECLQTLITYTKLNADESILNETTRLLNSQFPWILRLQALKLVQTIITNGISTTSSFTHLAKMLNEAIEASTENRYSKVRLAVLNIISALILYAEKGGDVGALFHDSPALKDNVLATVKRLQTDKAAEVSTEACLLIPKLLVL